MKLKKKTAMVKNNRLILAALIAALWNLSSCSDSDNVPGNVPGNVPSDVQSNDQQLNQPLSKPLNKHFEIVDAAADWTTVPLPDISRQPIKLSVASIVNSRFKKLTDSQIQQILQRSQSLVKQYFNIDIEFSEVEVLSIEDAFKNIDYALVKRRQKEIVDINFIDDAAKRKAREEMQEALYATMTNYSGNEQSVIDYAQPYLINPEVKQKDFIGLSYALVDTLLTRLNYWKSQTAADGAPVLNNNGYHEWVWWDSLGYTDMPYDIVITNQLVASAEYYAMDVHSSMRGGITAGTTTYSKHTTFNSYVYIMVYPMLNDTKLLEKLRSDKTYGSDQIVNYSAALLTHELGHMLLHLGHPFGNKACIMSPTVMLNYRDWYDNFNADLCAIGSNEDMEVGAIDINYNRSW